MPVMLNSRHTIKRTEMPLVNPFIESPYFTFFVFPIITEENLEINAFFPPRPTKGHLLLLSLHPVRAGLGLPGQLLFIDADQAAFMDDLPSGHHDAFRRL